MVEHLLAKEGVAGSIPVSRFYFLRGIQWIPLLLFCSHDVYRTRAGSMSRLPARSLLLLRRGAHQTPATRLAILVAINKFTCFDCKNEPNPGLEGSMSRLPARSLLLLRRVIHRMTATRLALFFTFLGVFCVCTYIWKILKLKHFPKKLIPYIKIRY